MDDAEPLLEGGNGAKCAVAVCLISRGGDGGNRCRHWCRDPLWSRMPTGDFLSGKRRASRQLTMHVVERQPVFQFGLARGRDLLREVGNPLLEIRIVLRELQG